MKDYNSALCSTLTQRMCTNESQRRDEGEHLEKKDLQCCMKDSERFLWVTREMLSLEKDCTPVNQSTVNNRVDSQGAAVALALPVGKLPVRLQVQALS
jgi:hypothetical protein